MDKPSALEHWLKHYYKQPGRTPKSWLRRETRESCDGESEREEGVAMQNHCEMPRSKISVTDVLFLPLESLDGFLQLSLCLCFSPPAVHLDCLFFRSLCLTGPVPSPVPGGTLGSYRLQQFSCMHRLWAQLVRTIGEGPRRISSDPHLVNKAFQFHSSFCCWGHSGMRRNTIALLAWVKISACCSPGLKNSWGTFLHSMQKSQVCTVPRHQSISLNIIVLCLMH